MFKYQCQGHDLQRFLATLDATVSNNILEEQLKICKSDVLPPLQVLERMGLVLSVELLTDPYMYLQNHTAEIRTVNKSV